MDSAEPSRSLPAHRSRRWLLVSLVVGVLLTAAPSALARGSIRHLVIKLERGVDFRVRVQAALELGKCGKSAARPPLEEALDDDNAAVRAAAAAALKVLGDEGALRALKAHRKDASPAVRSQVESSIAALERAAAKRNEKPEVLVELGKIRNGGRVRSRSVDADVERASREKIEELPGVALVETSAGKRRSKKTKKRKTKQKDEPPLVMVTGLVKKLDREVRGGSVTYSASIEFIMHQMPGQAIKGVISGSARASGDASEARDGKAMEELRRSALEAAIASAMRNAPEALRAAMR